MRMFWIEIIIYIYIKNKFENDLLPVYNSDTCTNNSNYNDNDKRRHDEIIGSLLDTLAILENKPSDSNTQSDGIEYV